MCKYVCIVCVCSVSVIYMVYTQLCYLAVKDTYGEYSMTSVMTFEEKELTVEPFTLQSGRYKAAFVVETTTKYFEEKYNFLHVSTMIRNDDDDVITL